MSSSRRLRPAAWLAALLSLALPACIHDTSFVPMRGGDSGTTDDSAADVAESPDVPTPPSCVEAEQGRTCDPVLQCGCPEGESCHQETGISSRRCQRAGSLPAGAACDFGWDCLPGYGCPHGTCVQYCNGTCSDGTRCLTIGGSFPGGFCGDVTCDPIARTSAAAGCPDGVPCEAFEVNTYPDNGEAVATMCLGFTGSLTEGMSCENAECAQGFECTTPFTGPMDLSCWRICRQGHDEDCAGSTLGRTVCGDYYSARVRGVLYGRCIAP